MPTKIVSRTKNKKTSPLPPCSPCLSEPRARHIEIIPPTTIIYDNKRITPSDFYGTWHMQGSKNISCDGKKLFFDETIVINEHSLYIETDSNFNDFLYLEITSWTPEINPQPKIKRKEYAAGFRLNGIRAPTSIGYKFESCALYINKKKTSLVRRVLENEPLPRFYVKVRS